MAAGDISYDSGMPVRAGNRMVIRGTIEVDDTPRAFAILDTKSRVVLAQVTPKDGAGSAQVKLNENAAGTETNGTLAVTGNHQSVDTYYFNVEYA